MINIEHGIAIHFNPENVDYYLIDRMFEEEKIELYVNKKLKEIDWAVWLIFDNKEATKTYEKIDVYNDECKAIYNITYSLNKTNESINVYIIDEGDTCLFTITVKNKSLVCYKPVINNRVLKFPSDLDSGTLMYSVDLFQILNGIFNKKNKLVS